MKNLNKFLITLFLLTALSSQAQNNARKGWDGVVKGGSKVNLSYSSAMPSTSTKDAYILSSSGISADTFIPFSLFRKGWDGTVKGGNFGINIGGTYSFGGNGNPSATLPNGFAIFGQTTSSVSYKGADPRNPSFRIGGGPQANFSLGEHFIISPILLAEYFSLTQKAISAVQTSQVNGQAKEYILWTQPETKTSGLNIVPKIRLEYNLTKSIGLFADGSYVFGPKIDTHLSTLIPLGNPSQSGQYESQQLDQGRLMKNEKSSTRYNALGFSIGVSFNFGADKGGNNINQPQPEGKTSSACNCVAPTPLYIKEYPSSGLTLSTSNPWPTYIPVSDLSSGKKMHFAFTTGPCYNTTSNPCYGYYKATVNGHSVNSSTVGYSSQTHLEIPVNYLVAGLNTITVQGISGTTICTLATSTVTVGSAPSSSGAVTLVKNCCVSISGPQHTNTYTGQTSFTMSGSVTGAVLEITSGGVISYEAFVNGGKTACYSKPITVRLVNNVTHVAIPTSTVNGLPLLSYNPKFNIDCMNRATISIKHNILAKVLVEGPDISDNWPTTSTFERNGLFTEDPDNHELVSTFTNPNTKEIVTIKSVVTVDEKGEMKLMKVQEASSTLNGITKPFKVLNSEEHHYVGHITLLK